MKKKPGKTVMTALLLLAVASAALADRRGMIFSLGLELEKLATGMAVNNFDHFKGWNNAISDQEQAILFKAEAFAASCRLFLRLTEERSGYYSNDFLRTNLFSAFVYLSNSFRELEGEMKKLGIIPYALSDCRKILDRLDREFAQWPAADNLAYLHQKYVKSRDATVYMIERKGPGVYIRNAFQNLESIYRYNYDLKRGKDPWKHLVEISEETLQKMPEGRLISLSFEGLLVIEQSNRPDRSVYLIQSGKKRGITSPQVLQRYGGWGKVFEVPREVIDAYPDGEPVY